MEIEGRFFGCHINMSLDRAEFLRSTHEGDSFHPRFQRLTRNGRHIEWFLMQTDRDLMRIYGIQFAKIMLDISVPHELRSFIHSRLRWNRGFWE